MGDDLRFHLRLGTIREDLRLETGNSELDLWAGEVSTADKPE